MLAFDRVAQRPGERAILDLPLDQVVLRAFFNSLRSQLLIVQSCQYDERNVRRGRVCSPDRLQADAVRQPQIQQYDVHSTFREVPDRIRDTQQVGQFERAGPFFAKHLTDQLRVAGVVLHQQNMQRRGLHVEDLTANQVLAITHGRALGYCYASNTTLTLRQFQSETKVCLRVDAECASCRRLEELAAKSWMLRS